MTNEIAKSGKLIIFGKNGCLCPGIVDSKGRSKPPNHIEEQDYFDDVELKCAELVAEGNTLAVISNEGGVSFGIFSADEAELLVKAAAEFIGAASYRVSFYHPNGKIPPWNQDHRTRLPSLGMIEELMLQFNATADNTLVVGDWKFEKEAAENAKVSFRWAHEFFGRVDPFADRMHAAMGKFK